MIRESVQTLNLGLKSLLLHKLRSALTTLGILFGVSSVIAMLAVGEGASFEAQETFKAMGSSNILLRSQKPAATEASSSESVWQATIYGLTYDDANRIEATLPQALDVVQVREAVVDLRHGANWSSGVLVGTSPTYLGVVNMAVDEGRWLTKVDDDIGANVAVLGGNTARKLFPLEVPLGQTVQAGTERFVVVGVLEILGRTSGKAAGVSLDDCLFIPLSTSRKRYGDERNITSGGSMSRERVELHEVKVRLSSPEEVVPAARVLRTMMDDIHGDAGDIDITVPLELLRQAEASAQIFNIVLGSIAAISLLVGGIGIMNVMLATVTERTREIGIRRALGAKKSHIVNQFLVETLVLSACGGILGVGLGLLIPILVQEFSGQMTITRMPHVLMAFSISALVGIAAGIYPAWRAANMDPVEALRHE